MKSIRKKVSKILLSLTMVFAMVLTMMPTNVFAAENITVKLIVVSEDGDKIYGLDVGYYLDYAYKGIKSTNSDGEVEFTFERPTNSVYFGYSIGGSSAYAGTSKFDLWETDSISDGQSAEITVEYTANSIMVTSNGNGTASADVSEAKLGDVVTLTATPDAGYQLKEWKSDNVTVANNTFTMPGYAVSVQAIFEAKPKSDKEKIDEAKPLAESAITSIIAINDTTAGNILDAVTTGISPVDGVTASWKAAPTIIKATLENAGSITGTIVLTCGSETVEVAVNKTINQLLKPDVERMQELVDRIMADLPSFTTSNNTTAEEIKNYVSDLAEGSQGDLQITEIVNPIWENELGETANPILIPATKEAEGSIKGTLKITCTFEVNPPNYGSPINRYLDIDLVIPKIPKTDKEKLDEAKPLAETAISGITATNSTTAGNILDAVTTAISPVDGVTASWKATPTITKATSSEAGSITGIIVLTCGSETVEINVNKLIEKLPAPTPETPTITTGNSGSNHQIKSGNDMTFTCSGKLEDLTGIYVDGKLVDESNYTLKSGSTILTLKSSYLDTLSAGKHTLKFQYKDNVSAETDFTITAKEAPKNDSVIKDTTSPKTSVSSSSAFYTLLLILLGCAVGTITYRSKKNFQ